MIRFLNHRHAFLSLLAAFCLMGAKTAYAAATITCTPGDFNSGGTISTQATLTGPNNMVMTTDGAITYPAALDGPAVGTTIVCTLAGWKANAAMTPRCNANRQIQSTGGCCGTATRNMTNFMITGTGNSTLAPTACRGGATDLATFNTDSGGGGLLKFGSTMDATHVTVGGTYLLSNNATGVLNMQISGKDAADASVTVTATADLSVLFAGLLSITSTTNVDFARIVYEGGALGSADHVDLGTDGTAAYAGKFIAGPGGTMTAGQVTINNAQNGVTVEVYCDATGTMTTADGASSITVTGIKAATESGTGSYAAAGSLCNGSAGAPALTMVYATGTADQFFFGGKLDGSTASSFSGGSYSSTNPGGTSMTVVVLNQ